MEIISPLVSAIDAVTHPNPYPFYAELVAHQPLYFDETLRLWVASSAEAVTQIMNHPACRVRPMGEPVPRGLVGSMAGVIFEHLARMNDGPKHTSLKHDVTARIAQLDVITVGQKWASDLGRGVGHLNLNLNEFAFALPVYIMADLLGVPSQQIPETVGWVREFARCLNPLSTPEQVAIGKTAAEKLMGMLQPAYGEIWAANLIGLMFQAYEATAGLIGNTLAALGNDPDLYNQVMCSPGLLPQLIQEMVRFDPAVQNTRRYLSEDVTVAGQAMQAGDAILVVLAAANRDPELNPEPNQFQLFRRDRRTFTFGQGVHSCPGEMLAYNMAQAGIEQMLWLGVGQNIHVKAIGYQPYVNLRIPILLWENNGRDF
ncbi:MAG: cytochrome P450 [Chloroflexi bacterium]|nr:cytochrome P450 [Chloroflexota bacterium]